MMTIADYEKEIENAKKKIYTNRNNSEFFKTSPIFGMHDTGRSDYETEMVMIEYYKAKIEKLKEEAKEAEAKEKAITAKAEKLGMSVEAYKAKIEKEKREKALKTKIKKYRNELAELEKRKTYLEKWLAENEG